MNTFRTTELSDSPYESSGIRFLTIKTSHLKGRGDICLYVPQTGCKLSNLPIYILLHGVYGSSWVWALKGGAAHTAENLIVNKKIKPAIIAMPSDGLWGDGSAYLQHNGNDFEKWIVDDVPKAIIENLPEASSSSQLCIGGLSMGGYGSMMLGAKHAHKFCAISAHSSMTKLKQMKQFVEEPMEEYESDGLLSDVIDAFKLHKSKLPKIRFDCGISDPLLAENRVLHQQMVSSGIKHIYQEFEGGHEWQYWREQVKKTFQFFNECV